MSDLPIDRRTWLAANGLAITGLLPVPEGAAEASPPRGLIRLSLNENAFGPSPRVAPAIAAESGRLNRYVEQPDADALIRQIATLERVRPDQVVLGEVLGPLGLALARSKQGGDIIFSTQVIPSSSMRPPRWGDGHCPFRSTPGKPTTSRRSSGR